MPEFNSKQLRDIPESYLEKFGKELERKPLYFILENIYDTYNIGSFFRLADGLASKKLFLCGNMETPPNTKIKRASVGTYKVVPWEYQKDTLKAIESLKKEEPNVKIYAVEQHKDSVDYKDIDYEFPLAFLFGNETRGVKKETIKEVDKVIEIPMYGLNISLNVIVAAGIIGYHALNKSEGLT